MSFIRTYHVMPPVCQLAPFSRFRRTSTPRHTRSHLTRPSLESCLCRKRLTGRRSLLKRMCSGLTHQGYKRMVMQSLDEHMARVASVLPPICEIWCITLLRLSHWPCRVMSSLRRIMPVWGLTRMESVEVLSMSSAWLTAMPTISSTPWKPRKRPSKSFPNNSSYLGIPKEVE